MKDYDIAGLNQDSQRKKGTQPFYYGGAALWPSLEEQPPNTRRQNRLNAW